jgi:putative transposase
MHFLWKLPENDSNYSQKWQMIKGLSTIRHNQTYKTNGKRIWQNRFWEHLIRGEKDYENHFHYIHINPIKHGYVNRLIDWRFSSFQDYVNIGVYDIDYGFKEGLKNDDGDYGE